MRKTTLLLMSLLFAQLAAMAANFESGTKLYLQTNTNWMTENARFAAYFYNNSGNTWVDMTPTGYKYFYEVTVPGSYTNVIFCRMNPENTANNWDNKWTQTADLTPVDGKNCFAIDNTSWDSGTWTGIDFPPTSLYIIGPALDGAENWDNVAIQPMIPSAEKIFTWTGTLYTGKEFKFRQNENDWNGVQYSTQEKIQTGTSCTMHCGGDNCTWNGKINEYNVTVDLANATLNITPSMPNITELYIAGGALDNWNKRVKMESTDGTTYTWHGKLSGGFKFFTNATSDNGQLGAAATTNLDISIGTIYDLAYTSSNAMKTFNLAQSISCTVRVNVKTKQIRILPEDIYITGSSTVAETGSVTEWGASDVQECIKDKENGTYAWTGYLYNNNGDADGSRFKFILGSDNACGQFIPETEAVHPTYDTPYKLVFKWDDLSNQLFYSEGAEGSDWRSDLKTFSTESQATRLKVKAVIDLDAMTVTFSKVNVDYTIDKLYIAGAGTEFGETGRGELTLQTDEYGNLYECVVNIIDPTQGFLFPMQQDALLPAMQACTDNYTAHQFELSGLDYCAVGETSNNQFKAETAGVYRVEIRPDYNSLKLYSFDTSYPAQNGELAGTTEGKAATSMLRVKFFEEIADVDASKIHISPQSWTTIDGAPHAIVVKSTNNNTISFQPNSWDTCLDFGKDYTITFDEGAVTFAPITRAATATRHNPAFSYSFNLADQIIGTGIEKCETTRNIAYKNRIVTAEGTISVYNIAGLLIAEEANQVDLTNVAQGIYIVRCGNETLKIVR